MRLRNIFKEDTVFACTAGFNLAATVTNLLCGNYVVAAANSLAAAVLLGWVANSSPARHLVGGKPAP